MEMDISPGKRKKLHLASVICENKNVLGEFKMQRMLLIINQNGTVPLKLVTCYSQSTKMKLFSQQVNNKYYRVPFSF